MMPLTPNEVIESYEHLARVTSRMREAATSDDWQQVIELESECSSVYARLIGAEETGPADEGFQRRKAELIMKLLDDDAQIRERLSGELTRIWRMIDGRQRVQKLSAAYRVGEHGNA
jgi:flagellar protein FliT